MNIKISIITVTYNSEETIRETLESVHGQSYSDIEHIIIDCCSSDRTLDIVKDFPVNKIVSEPDRGIYDAMNKGINYAAGDVIGFLNSDDVFEDKESIKNIANEFKNENQLDIVYGNLVLVSNKNLNKIVRYKKSKPYQPDAIFNGWLPPHPTLYVKADRLRELKGFKIKYKIAGDFELMIRLFEVEKLNSKYINKTLVRQRLGGISTDIRNIIASNLEASDACKLNGYKGGLFFIIKKLISRIPEFFNK
jgi:glycosyltransferase involved in cell wall biosynthesis